MNFLLAVVLSWPAPTERVNGAELLESEIGGYVVRTECSSTIEHFTVNALSYSLSNEYIGCDISVAVFDTDGLYSDFVTAVERPNTETLRAPMRGGIK